MTIPTIPQCEEPILRFLRASENGQAKLKDIYDYIYVVFKVTEEEKKAPYSANKKDSIVNHNIRNSLNNLSSESRKLVTNIGQQVWALTDGAQTPANRDSFSINPAEPARNALIEKAAINHVIEKFEKDGFNYRSVENDNVGWDLEFTKGNEKLCVEVKGRAGSRLSVELTPNEYEAMEDQKTAAYRLAIVTCALDQPRLAVIRFHPRDKSWRDRDHVKFLVSEKTGARVSRE